MHQSSLYALHVEILKYIITHNDYIHVRLCPKDDLMGLDFRAGRYGFHRYSIHRNAT